MRRTIGGLAGVLVTTILSGITVGAQTAPVPEAAPPQAAPVPPAASPEAPAPTVVRSGGQVRGSISYGRRSPAVGVVVIVRPDEPGSRVYAATTGEAGTFGFDGVPNGTYRAEARRDGFATVVKTGIVVRAPFRAVVELVLAPGTSAPEAPEALEGGASLAGHVRVAGGAPLAEARVRVVRPDALADPRTMLTDAAGAFEFDELPAGRWRLEVTGAGLLPLRTDLALAGGTTLEVALARQPANYQPLAQDLIVPEDVIPPKAP
jgi:hypothetical protein